MHYEKQQDIDEEGSIVYYDVLVADDGDFTCECGNIVGSGDAFECTKCGETFCRQCFNMARTEFAGGVNVGGLDVNYCYTCSESGVERLLEDLQD